MSKSPWGKIGNWAAETERAEAEEREAAEKAAAAQPPASFPTLKEAATAAKQKKKTKMTLQEFTMKLPAYSGSASSRGLTPEEMLRLPTGPKERSPDEMQHGRLGGGFNNYGSRPGYGGLNTGRSREYDIRRSYAFDDDNRRGPPPESRVSDLKQPSRADEVDNWASMKKQTLSDYNSRQDRPGGKYSSLGGGGGPGAGSKADEVDNWASVKKHFPQTQQTRSSGFGSGFSRPESDRWAGNNQGFGSGFPRPEPDRWTRNEQRSAVGTPKNEIDVVPKVNKPNPFGAARPREEVLAEKGLDWKKLDLEIEVKKQSSVTGGSRPTSSHSSRPGSQQSSRSDVPVALGGEGVVKDRPKVNPFGNAKPREVLLEEKGLDWKKIDLQLEHRQVERPETVEEKNLREQIEHLKNELLKNPVEGQTAATSDLIRQKERDLELLIRQLDEKVRYNPKMFERKNFGSATGSGLNGQPPSRPGSQGEHSRAGSIDRPPSMHGKYEDPNRPPSRPGSYENSREGFLRQRAYEEPRTGFTAYEEPRTGFTDRPRSRHGGGYEEPRGLEYNERPRSRGAGNSWARPSDDRRSFGGGGFAGSREIDRSGSRW